MSDSRDEHGADDLFGDFEDQPTIRGLRVNDSILGRFSLKECLGRGGMGEVWLARDSTLDEDVALKMLPRMIHFDPQAVEELKNESKRGRQLSHPNIIKVFDFYQDDENTGIAMEYVKGENLAALRAKAPQKVFSVDEIKGWVTEFLQGLEYAHQCEQVVHRDLKPSNVMIESKSGRLKIADFGIARCVADSMERVTISTQSRGTLCYMSPEQAKGRGVNHLDDLYSFGATIYELLTGAPPFFTGDIFSQITQVAPVPIVERQKERGILNPQPVPAVWESTIMQCLEKDRAARPASAGVILEALGLGTASYKTEASVNESVNPVMESRDLTYTEIPTRDYERPVEESRRKLPVVPLVVAGGLLLLAGMAGGAFYLFGDKDTEGPGGDKVVDGGKGTVDPGNTGPVPGGGEPKPPINVEPVDPAPRPDPIPKPDPKPEPQMAKKDPEPVKPDPVDPRIALLKEKYWNVPGLFDTIQEAIDAAEPGKVILLEGKTYDERIVLKSGIAIHGQGTAKTVVRTRGDRSEAVAGANAENIELKGIKFEHLGEQLLANGKSVGSFTNCNNVKVLNCEFHKGMEHGLFVSGYGEMTISDSVFSNNNDSGVWCEGGASVIMKKCHSHHNNAGVSIRGISSQASIGEESKITDNVQNGVEIKQQGRLTMTGNCEITGNKETAVFARSEGTGIELKSSLISKSKFGVLVDEGASVLIDDCKYTSNDISILLNNPGKAVVKNSEIRGSTIYGINFEAVKSSGEVAFLNNTIANCGHFGVAISGSFAKPQTSDNKLGPNGQGDMILANEASGRYLNNKFFSAAGCINESNALVDESNVHTPKESN